MRKRYLKEASTRLQTFLIITVIEKSKEGEKDISLPESVSITTSSIDSKYWLQRTGE